ncbi:hypothetical protein [Streptomyces sp. TLI_171]|uniref:hypothetical protein n=1 Tax=Streptomyces sp. TLI_171 TaxID=1938859 RepID=UPI000C1A6DC7|nr:hypothetical protein [Streptomyces sp. TLI_171]RKE19261.1 hypothetical protein BX266_2577 [Streptomyces sp. TLI_171]
MSTSGKGFQVEVDSLRAFAAQVRGLLKEFDEGAGTAKVYGPTGIGTNAFGTFPEAQALHAKYTDMREALNRILFEIQDTIDQVQQNADHTATNYEEQERNTRQRMSLAHDGWSATWDQASLDRANTGPTQATPTQSRPTDGARPQW